MTSVVDLSETKNAKRKKEELEAVIADQEKLLQFIRKGRMVLAEMEEERNKETEAQELEEMDEEIENAYL